MNATKRPMREMRKWLDGIFFPVKALNTISMVLNRIEAKLNFGFNLIKFFYKQTKMRRIFIGLFYNFLLKGFIIVRLNEQIERIFYFSLIKRDFCKF